MSGERRSQSVLPPWMPGTPMQAANGHVFQVSFALVHKAMGHSSKCCRTRLTLEDFEKVGSRLSRILDRATLQYGRRPFVMDLGGPSGQRFGVSCGQTRAHSRVPTPPGHSAKMTMCRPSAMLESLFESAYDLRGPGGRRATTGVSARKGVDDAAG